MNSIGIPLPQVEKSETVRLGDVPEENWVKVHRKGGVTTVDVNDPEGRIVLRVGGSEVWEGFFWEENGTRNFTFKEPSHHG